MRKASLLFALLIFAGLIIGLGLALRRFPLIDAMVAG